MRVASTAKHSKKFIVMDRLIKHEIGGLHLKDSGRKPVSEIGGSHECIVPKF
jgi:hypothetical protein